ncbi:MAG: DUF481 domain-containing protein [Gammaproteobacteria bacterium]|nr:DUF481 domain-containing protein [Gammaproteobacteria bacterium]
MHNLPCSLWLADGGSAPGAWSSWLLRPAYAVAPPQAKKTPFGASVGFGYAATTGLATTRTVDSRDHAFYEDGLWRYAGRVSYNYISTGARVSANRLAIDASAERFLSRAGTNFLLAAVRFDHNPFSGYSHYLVESLGAGHRIFERAGMALKVEGGLGMRQNDYVNGRDSDVPVVRAALTYHWAISRHSLFTERLGVMAATSGTLFSSASGLSTPIDGALALKLSELVEHYTSAPLGFPRTTTFSTVNLLYHFP